MIVTTLYCPYCHAGISANESKCPYCDHEYVIKQDNQMDFTKQIMDALEADKESFEKDYMLGMGYLDKKLYDKALDKFERAIEMDQSVGDCYFLAAVSLLKGKIPFTTPKADVDKAIGFLSAAMSTEYKPVYQAMSAYLKYDFYKRKALKTKPNHEEDLTAAIEAGLTGGDVQDLFQKYLKLEVSPLFKGI